MVPETAPTRPHAPPSQPHPHHQTTASPEPPHTSPGLPASKALHASQRSHYPEPVLLLVTAEQVASLGLGQAADVIHPPSRVLVKRSTVWAAQKDSQPLPFSAISGLGGQVTPWHNSGRLRPP